MKHCGTQLIETERLILRRFVTEDAEPMFRNWTSDDEVTKFLAWPTHPNVDVSRMIVTDWVERYKNDDWYQWAIVPKDTGEPVGSIAAVDVKEDINAVHITGIEIDTFVPEIPSSVAFVRNFHIGDLCSGSHTEKKYESQQKTIRHLTITLCEPVVVLMT